MAIRKWMVVASLALTAALAMTVASVGSAKSAATDEVPRRARDRHRRPQRQGLQRLAYKGLQRAIRRRLGVEGRVFISKTRGGLHPEPLTGAEGYDLVHRNRLPDGRLDGGRREAVPEHQVRRSSTSALPGMKGKPKNVRGIVFAEQEAGCLVGRRRGDGLEDERHQLGGRPQDPAGRCVHRRVPVLREEGQAGHHDAQRLLAGLRRPGQVQGDRAQPDAGQDADVVFQVAGGCGLGALQAAKEGREVGHRRGQRPGLPGHPRPHERHEEGRRRASIRRSSSPPARSGRAASTASSTSRTRASATARSARRRRTARR